MFQIVFLTLGLVVLTLVIAFIFKKQQRVILWAAALILFIGTCLMIGLGVVNIYENGVVNQNTLFSVILVFFCSAKFACDAEKTHRALQKKAATLVEQSSNPPNEESTEQETPGDVDLQGDNAHVQLTGKLDTPLARDVFARALKAGLMKEVDGHYKWKKSKALLAYMCGRIYCGDKPEYDEREEKTYWKFGRTEFFPETELNALFGEKDLGQSRTNRKDLAVPQGSNKTDDLFKQPS